MTNNTTSGKLTGTLPSNPNGIGQMASATIYGAATGKPISVASGGVASGYTWGAGMSISDTITPKTLKVVGDAEFDGDIKINGVSLTETISKIQERLNILVPNQELEKEWEELATLRRHYVELERELIEKQRTFDILKN